MEYGFDRFLRYDDLSEWLHDMQQKHPHLILVESYGKSQQGRDLWLVTVTDKSTGLHHEKPAHWVDANIHSTETTSGVAACHLIHHLAVGYTSGNSRIVEALRTRTFYIAPRVNPDGVEAALADNPTYLRSSVRPWPWAGHKWPGIVASDIDGDGNILTMRVKDPHGAWVSHPSDDRVMIPVDHKDSPLCPLPSAIGSEGPIQRYRLLTEGMIENYDGFTIPTPGNRAGLDLNRNFPAGWGKEVKGSGEHALSEPEIYHLVRAITSRPNVCGYNAYHTAGGVLLRPHSCKPDSDLSPVDLWVFKEMGERGTELTGNPTHSCFEDFTFDKKHCMSGASDDFMYDHVGVFSWTTEFWDVIYAATGHRASTKIWYLGPTVDEMLAIAKWADANAPEFFQPWRPFTHPQLGQVELGGPNDFRLITNPPPHLLKQEVAPHSDFAIYQAMLSPKLEVVMTRSTLVGRTDVVSGESKGIWRVDIGIANTGFLPTNVTEKAIEIDAVLPVSVEIMSATGECLVMADGHSPQRVKLGQLSGRLATRVDWSGCDGTPDRAMATWTLLGNEGDSIHVLATHPRAGTSKKEIVLSKQ